MLNNGMFLVDRYEILSKVGAGGMSDVYKAKDHVLGRVVAVKVLKAEFSEDVNFVTKFRTEAQSAAGLEHPNIVNIYDVGSENGLHFIVMEYVEGITLKTYIDKKGQLSFKEATSIAIQVARGIEVAHNKEIIHRDIKPQNVIISTEGKVKVTDFGIARAITSNTISAEVMGSVHYASPEQARNGFVDGRSDIYSLGIVMYEMVTGRVPFDGDSTVSVAIKHLQEEMVEPSVYAPELPISYEKIVMKATQKNPDRRYQTIEELLADLRKALANPDEDFVVIAPAAIAKTRIIGGEELEAIQNSAAGTETAAPQTETDDLDEEDEDDEEAAAPTNWDKALNIGLIVVAALIVVAVIGLAISLADLFKKDPVVPPVGSSSSTEEEPSSAVGSTEPSSTEEKEKMPNIVGLDWERAEDWLESLGFQMNIIKYEQNTGKADGVILEQSETEGTELKKGSVIHVTVAGDNPAIFKKKVPTVVGITEADAKQILDSYGFKVEIDYAYSDSIAEGYIASQNPAAGEEKTVGSTITIYISRGKAPHMVPSNLAGQHKETVKYLLEQEGFVVNFIEENSDTVKKDNVISVMHEGTEQQVGTTIDVIVSAGPAAQEPEKEYTFEKTIQAPDGVKFYTYVLYDKKGKEIVTSGGMQTITSEDGKIEILVEKFKSSGDNGKIEITWYMEPEEGGNPVEFEEKYQASVKFTEVKEDNAGTENPGTTQGQQE